MQQEPLDILRKNLHNLPAKRADEMAIILFKKLLDLDPCTIIFQKHLQELLGKNT
jgi:hypothetical protein